MDKTDRNLLPAILSKKSRENKANPNKGAKKLDSIAHRLFIPVQVAQQDLKMECMCDLK